MLTPDELKAMSKDQLAEHALAELGLEVDKRKSKDTIIEEIERAQQAADRNEQPPAVVEETDEPEESDPIEPAGGKTIDVTKASHFMHPKNRRVYPATKPLVERFVRYRDIIPCNEKGQSLSVLIPKSLSDKFKTKK